MNGPSTDKEAVRLRWGSGWEVTWHIKAHLTQVRKTVEPCPEDGGIPAGWRVSSAEDNGGKCVEAGIRRGARDKQVGGKQEVDSIFVGVGEVSRDAKGMDSKCHL